MKYVVLAMHAHPQPVDPYNPLPPSTTTPNSAHSDSDTVRHPSPFVPIRIPVFGLVIWLNDAIVRVLSVGGGRPGHGSRGSQKSRDLTELEESVEMGESWEMKAKEGVGAQGPRVRQGRERVTLGRRKVD